MEPLGPRVRVRAALPLQGFKVLLTFDNDARREVDLEPYLRGPIFEPLRSDLNRFRSMTIAGGDAGVGQRRGYRPGCALLPPQARVAGRSGNGSGIKPEKIGVTASATCYAHSAVPGAGLSEESPPGTAA